MDMAYADTQIEITNTEKIRAAKEIFWTTTLYYPDAYEFTINGSNLNICISGSANAIDEFEKALNHFAPFIKEDESFDVRIEGDFGNEEIRYRFTDSRVLKFYSIQCFPEDGFYPIQEDRFIAALKSSPILAKKVLYALTFEDS